MITIIIPVFNEAAIIQQNLQNLLSISAHVEIIVVDGGSHDQTLTLAQAMGVKTIVSRPKKSLQMNRGAAVAKGDILLFLHADTILPPDYTTLIKDTLAQPNTVAGAFRLKINAPQRSLRLVEKMVNWRSRFFALPYGDQAIFLKSYTFHDLGGFADLPIMEDFDLIQRLKKQGIIHIAPAAVLTSPRRWQKLGVFKTTLVNQLIIIGYFLGVAPQKLANFYRRIPSLK